MAHPHSQQTSPSSYLEPSSSSSTPPPLCRAPPSPSPSDTSLVFLRSTIMPAAAAAKVRARLLRHHRRSRRSNPPALEWMTRTVAAQRLGDLPLLFVPKFPHRFWRQNSSQDVDCGRPHHSRAPATLSTNVARPPPALRLCAASFVRRLVSASLSLPPSPHL